MSNRANIISIVTTSAAIAAANSFMQLRHITKQVSWSYNTFKILDCAYNSTVLFWHKNFK